MTGLSIAFAIIAIAVVVVLVIKQAGLIAMSVALYAGHNFISNGNITIGIIILVISGLCMLLYISATDSSVKKVISWVGVGYCAYAVVTTNLTTGLIVIALLIGWGIIECAKD